MYIKQTTMLMFAVFSMSAGCHAASLPTYIYSIHAECLIGGYGNNQWFSVEKLMQEKSLPSKYQLFGANKSLGQVKGPKPTKIESPCGDSYELKLKVPNRNASIAIGNKTFDVYPRPVKTISNTHKRYVKVVEKILLDKGFKQPIVDIKHIYKVDIDGDGVDEVIISATHIKKDKQHDNPLDGIPDLAAAGDYSFVAMRKVVNEKLQTEFINSSFFPRKGVYDKATGYSDVPYKYLLSAIIDVDGDGVYEIITSGATYTNRETIIYKLDSGKFEEKQFCGCGT